MFTTGVVSLAHFIPSGLFQFSGLHNHMVKFIFQSKVSLKTIFLVYEVHMVTLNFVKKEKCGSESPPTLNYQKLRHQSC